MTSAPPSSSSRERWNFAAASSAASGGGHGPDPYPSNGVSTPPVTCRSTASGGKRFSSSFRGSVKGVGDGSCGGSTTIAGEQSKSSSSSKTTATNHRGSTRFSSFRKTEKSDLETKIGGDKKGPKRRGSWLLRSLFGRQSDAKSSSNAIDDLWVDIPLWTPLEQSPVDPVVSDRKSVVELRELTGNTRDTSGQCYEPIIYGRRFAADFVSPLPGGEPLSAAHHEEVSCLRHDRIDGGDLPLLRRTKSGKRGTVRGVRFSDSETSPARSSARRQIELHSTNTSVGMEFEPADVRDTEINRAHKHSRPPPNPLLLSTDDPMELDLSAFDAVIESLRNSTDDSAFHTSNDVDDWRRNESDECTPMTIESNVVSQGGRSVNFVSDGVVQPTRAASKLFQLDSSRSKPALLPKPAYLASRSGEKIGKTRTSYPAGSVDRSELLRQSSSLLRDGNERAVSQSSGNSSIPLSQTRHEAGEKSLVWRETDLASSLPTIFMNSTSVRSLQEIELPAVIGYGHLPTSTTSFYSLQRKKKHAMSSYGCQNFADETVETVRRNETKPRNGNEITVTAVIENTDENNCVDSFRGDRGGSFRRRTSAKDDVTSKARPLQMADVAHLSKTADDADKWSSVDVQTPSMTTEQWLDSLHRKKKFRAVDPVGLTDAERLSAIAKSVDGVTEYCSGLPVSTNTSPNVPAGHSMSTNAGNRLRSGKVKTGAAHGSYVDNRTSAPSGTADWVTITIDNEDALSITSDVTRYPERRSGATSSKPTSFFSRFRRAMVSGFESLLGRNSAADYSPKSQNLLAMDSTSGNDSTISGGGSSSLISEPPVQSAASSRFASSCGINQSDYDKMTELEKLSILADKMAFEKQKVQAPTGRLEPQHSVEQLTFTQASHGVLTSAVSLSPVDGDNVTCSTGVVQRSKSCHNMRGGQAAVASTSKFLMTPTSAIGFDDMIARFANVRVSENDATSGTVSRSASNTTFGSGSYVAMNSTVVPEEDGVRRREPPVRPLSAETDDHRRISMTSSLSSSSSSSGFGSLRRSKTALCGVSQAAGAHQHHHGSSLHFASDDEYRTSNGMLASVSELPSSLPVSPNHSADDQRMTTNRSAVIVETSCVDQRPCSGNHHRQSAISATTPGGVVLDDVTDEALRLRRRPLPVNNSFTCDQTTSRASHSLALQFFQHQQRRAQMSMTSSPGVTGTPSSSKEVPGGEVPAVEPLERERSRQLSVESECRQIGFGDRSKTVTKLSPLIETPSSTAIKTSLSGIGGDCFGEVDELSRITFSLKEVSAAIEKKLRANESLTDDDEAGGRISMSSESRLEVDNNSRSAKYANRMSVNDRCREKRYSKRAARPRTTASALSTSGAEPSIVVGGTLPDWVSTVSFPRRGPVDQNDEDDAGLWRERVDDIDLGVDVTEDDDDIEDDGMSTSTLTDNGSIRSAASRLTTSSDRSGTTVTADDDDYDLPIYSPQRHLASTIIDSLSNRDDTVDSEFSSIESLTPRESPRSLRSPVSDLNLTPSSSSAMFDCVAYGGSLPTSYRRATAVAAAASERLQSPRAASSLAVGRSSCQGFDAAVRTKMDDDGKETWQDLTRGACLSADVVIIF